MAVETFPLLEKIIKQTVADSLQKQNFDFQKFFYEMEQGFSALGFRDSDELTQGAMEDILIVDFHSVGNFILTTPAIRELRRNYPFSSITLLTNQGCKALAENSPYVNEILIFDDTYATRNILDYMVFATEFAKKNLWQKRYRLAFYLNSEPNFFHQFLMYLSGAKERVGYVMEVKRVYSDDLLPQEKNPSFNLLTRPFVYPKQVVHEVERNLYLLEAFNLQVQSNYPELWYNASDTFRAKVLLKKLNPKRLKVVVGLGSSQGEGQYTNYLPALQQIIESGADVILLGGKAEAKDASTLQAKLPPKSVVNLCSPELPWTVTAAVVSQANIYIGNSTGTMHFAAACRLPVIVLSREAKDRPEEFDGVSAYYRFFPWQTNAIILQPEHPIEECVEYSKQLNTSTCSHSGTAHCIKQIKPEEIVTAYDKMVDFMKNIKELKPSPIIRNIDQVHALISDQNL